MATIKAKGIDVSKYQPKIDWNKVKNAGYDFVIIRAGYRGWGSAGTLATDNYFKSHIEGAIKAGLDIGIYWFTQAKTEAEAISEANYCLKLITPYKKHITYPVYDDVEWGNNAHTGRADKLTKAQYTANALAFCRTIEAAGFNAGVYANQDWFRNKVDVVQVKNAGFSIWCAKFSTSPPSIAADYDIWQYSSTVKVPGITNTLGVSINVDANYAYVDLGNTVPMGWYKTAGGWRYGTVKSAWKKLNGYWYWFDANGYAVTGWHKVKNVWYYFCTLEDHNITGYPECSCLEISKG